MKAAVYEGIEKITVKDVPKPVCGPDNILVRVKSCAICGTDIRTFHHGKSNVKPPQVLGHEIAGVIEEVGKKVTGFTPGNRVAVAAVVSCGHCYYCQKNLQNLCENFTALGYEHSGAFAEYLLVPPPMLKDGSVNKLPLNLSFDEASLAEPFACAINGQELSRVGEGDKVLIVGAGPIGCMHIAIARARGAGKVILSEISEQRRQMAKKFGADVYLDPSKEDVLKRVMEETGNRGVDVAIVAAPSARAQEEALKMLAFRGRLNCFGGLPKDNPWVRFDGNLIHYKEVFIHGTSGSLPRHNQEALQVLGAGKVKGQNFITHTFPLEKILEGIKVVESGEGLKVIINP